MITNTKMIDALPKKIFRLKEKLGGVITEEQGVYTLNFDSLYGKGEIKHYILNNGITVYNFNVILYDDLVFNLETENNNSLYFSYCTQGLCYFKSKNDEKYIKIDELRPTIISNSSTSLQQLNIKKNVDFTFNLIEVNTVVFLNSFNNSNLDANSEIEGLTQYLNNHKFYLKLNAYNLKVSDKLRISENEITTTTTPLTRMLRVKSVYLHILALYLEQFNNEVNENKIVSTLSKSELQKIRNLTNFIVNSPETQHTINSLCNQISMSPAKLQEGFKAMHGTTVADFVRNVRIEKAEKLLLESDLNISEIVYTIGLTSRSYFCKIFKGKYNCSPKRYRKMSLKNKTVVL